MQSAPSGQLDLDNARLPGPGPGRRSSKFKGVSWAEACLKWRTQIWTGAKVRWLAHHQAFIDMQLGSRRLNARGADACTGPGLLLCQLLNACGRQRRHARTLPALSTAVIQGSNGMKVWVHEPCCNNMIWICAGAVHWIL